MRTFNCFLPNECHQLAFQEGHGEREEDATWHQVKQGWLCVLEVEHHTHGDQQTNDVGDEACIKVRVLSTALADIEAKQQSDKDTWNDNITKTQHRKLGAMNAVHQEVLWKDQLNGGIKRLGHGNHNIGIEHPKDVVEKQTRQEKASGGDAVQVDEFDSLDGKREAKQIVGQPMLF